MIGTGLVTLGETMALLNAVSVGKLRHTTSMTLGIGGAESNVAIGVHRLGTPATWIGRVGDDELGEFVITSIRGEGVRTHPVIDEDAPTGLMLKHNRIPGVSTVNYYRAGSAGSRLDPSDLDEQIISGANVLHLSGITSALSISARNAVHSALDIAAAAHVPISFDINYRSALWPYDRARPALREIARRATIVFAGDDEAALLGFEGTPLEQADALSAFGPSEAVIKLGAHGAVAVADGRQIQAAAHTVDAVDPVGAGDAFVAGYLADRINNRTPDHRLATATACGAFAVTAPGDWEGLPTRRDLALLSTAPGTVTR